MHVCYVFPVRGGYINYVDRLHSCVICTSQANWRSKRSECSHSQVIKIEICDKYMFDTCESYWACAKKVIAMAMTFDGQRSSCRSDVEKTVASVLRKR